MDIFLNYNKRKIIYNDVYLGYVIDDFIINDDDSKTVFNNIDKIYIISLEHRCDRRDKLIKNLQKLGVQKVSFLIPLKISDITIYDLKKLNGIFFENLNNNIINHTVAGCFLSHLICFKDLSNFNLNNYLIIEDDCEILNISNEIYLDINNFIINEEYDTLFLHDFSKLEINNKYKIDKLIRKNIITNFDFNRFETIKKYNNIGIFFGTSLAHFIIYSSKFINYLASNLKIIIKKNTVRNIDFCINILGKKFNYYKTKQNCTTQFQSFSDITFTNNIKG